MPLNILHGLSFANCQGRGAAWPKLVSEKPISVTGVHWMIIPCPSVFGQPRQTRLRRCDPSDVQSTCSAGTAKNLPAMWCSLRMPEFRRPCQCHLFVTGGVSLFQNPRQLQSIRFSKLRTSASHPMLKRPSYLVVSSLRGHRGQGAAYFQMSGPRMSFGVSADLCPKPAAFVRNCSATTCRPKTCRVPVKNRMVHGWRWQTTIGNWRRMC